ncbi:hypothetical protein AURDEDRAFT_178104 [Auricularia subglabra TFB-10046 SS5]|uniref:Uncharacterized protein n=1 Tax=Auricularia subglabra (strain TFB-10046 / SS5) TaxID=717982 RepID=J0CRB2_AURST|nr:hypothetical protein AURDEDRAFT_178104 [Auricularia subglabra TFB-10046 SS5]
MADGSDGVRRARAAPGVVAEHDLGGLSCRRRPASPVSPASCAASGAIPQHLLGRPPGAQTGAVGVPGALNVVAVARLSWRPRPAQSPMRHLIHEAANLTLALVGALALARPALLPAPPSGCTTAPAIHL